MSDDLKPHQRLVRPTWQETLERGPFGLNGRDELPEIMALLAASGLRSNARFNIHQDTPEPKIDPKKARRRVLVKAARKQKHGRKR